MATDDKSIPSKDAVLKELTPKKSNFEVDKFENLILQDITQNDESTAQKLHRNLTDMFNDWINQKVRAKEQIKINIKGETRCHPEGTMVLMHDLSEKPIEKIRHGDRVISYDEDFGVLEIQTVDYVWDNGVQDVYEVLVSGGNRVLATNTHKFTKMNGERTGYEWRPLSSFREGEYIGHVILNLVPYSIYTLTNKLIRGQDSPGDIYQYKGLIFRQIESIVHKGRMHTYDLNISKNHNYVTNGILTSNSGKSLVGMKISKKITDQYDRSFDANRIICANQKELRQKLQEADFGEVKQVDENAFANTGVGSHVEMQQLKDINNIIAKQNIHMIYITPRTFLDTGATLGLAYFGKDTDNWLSRFLLYSLKGGNPVLLGYVTFDVGSLFRETGCLMYHTLGGCTNPSQKTKDRIPDRFLRHSDCIPKDYDPEKVRDDGKVCPFYEICTSAMAQYEHKKDSWIAREMRGDLDERTRERYELAIACLKIFGVLDDDGSGREIIKLTASNQKDMRNKVKAKLPRLANTKLTITEQEEILSIIQSMTNVSFLEDICEMLEIDSSELKSYLSTEPWDREDPTVRGKGPSSDKENEEQQEERNEKV